MIPEFRAFDRQRGLMEVIAMNNNLKVLTLQGGGYSPYLMFLDEVVLLPYSDLTDQYGEKLGCGDICLDGRSLCYGEVTISDGKFSFEWESIVEDLYEVCDELCLVGNVYEDGRRLLEN